MSEGKLLKDKEVKSRSMDGEWKPPFSGDQDIGSFNRKIGIIERIKIFFTGYSETESRVRFLFTEFSNGYGIISAKYDATNQARITIEQGLADSLIQERERNEVIVKDLSETKRINGQAGVKIRNYEEKLKAINDSYSELRDLYDQKVLDIQDLAQIDKLRKETALAKRNSTILQKKLTVAENLVEEKEEHIRILQAEVDGYKEVDMFEEKQIDLSEKCDTDLSS